MTDLNTPSILSKDPWVEHPQGRIFVRCCTPSNTTQASSPIVLFHDSLGCVDLRRDFPRN